MKRINNQNSINNNSSIWGLQITNSINNIISLFASTFLVSFITQTNIEKPLGETLVAIGLFYCSLYLVMAISYFVLGYLVDRSNRIAFYRFGIIVKGVFIVVIIEKRNK